MPVAALSVSCVKSLWLQLKSFLWLQAGPNTLQQNEYGGLADLLARYWEDRSKYTSRKKNNLNLYLLYWERRKENV